MVVGASLAVLAGCSAGDGSFPRVPTTTTSTSSTTSTTPAELTVRGVVAAVSASARVVTLTAPVNGVGQIALTLDTEIVRSTGARATLADVAPGATVEATGRPGSPGTVVARRLVLR